MTGIVRALHLLSEARPAADVQPCRAVFTNWSRLGTSCRSDVAKRPALASVWLYAEQEHCEVAMRTIGKLYRHG